MIFVSGEKNFVDQRHLENELWNTHGVRAEFLTLAEVQARCILRDGNTLSIPLKDGKYCDISVVYFRYDLNGTLNDEVELYIDILFRAGYSPADYPTENEWTAREMIESSSAMKCPSIAYQLTGAKSIQQRLSEKGI